MHAALLTLALTAGYAIAQPAVTDVCRVTDQRLAELSGLASDGEQWYAVNDSDDGRVEIHVLDRTCRITDTITADVDPYDVEDLALAPDGTFWLADTGDNTKSRETVALHAVSRDGTARLFRLTYPDGKHDAEALLLDASGVPHIVTKEPLGSPLVYRPAAELSTERPTPLEQVGRVPIKTTETTGGPLQSPVVTRLVTGGAMSKDGKVAALRTYTDAYLFTVPDNDLVKALESTPVRIPLPDEPQGEAIAFEPDGTLLSASEFDRQPDSVIRAVPNAALAAPQPTTTTQPPPTTEAQPEPPPAENRALWPVIGGGAAALALLALTARRLRRRR
ncbi:esterase-like activity of phytase family protein [Saccharothrix obliqua]|uniref:esterase-like activity of phytase family protein n=1 Tax=Saccharothrix obliqua TaxID=2861747 RepID=UPI001C6048DE|nr:esterase-like activity of phytase family protein [Saccharothrix obliqua]MBW4722274.1 esterase-like activity of phytase family protein [Saccharothrix obliqua]